MTGKAAALDYLRFARQTHVEWRDWFLAHPDDDRVAILGTAEQHAADVVAYDNIIALVEGICELCN